MEEFCQNSICLWADYLSNLVWSWPLLALIFGCGLYLTVILKGLQFRYLGYAFQQVLAEKKEGAQGDISPFEALMTTLAGAIGTGSIVGVATALTMGGVGAIFWMWIAAIFGMATKYAESLLAVKYRTKDAKGEMVGGPMEYIERGLGWKWMAILFAVLASVAAMGAGNLVQANSIGDSFYEVLGINPWFTGIGLAIVTGIVILGGIKSVGHVAGVLVPVMALFYLGAGILILIFNHDKVLDALWLIVQSGFTPQAAIGGFSGASVYMAFQIGSAHSVFTSEAGIGISSVAAAAANTDSPSRQALITMTGSLLSTVLICTVSALAILVTDSFGAVDVNGKLVLGASMAIRAFNSAFSAGGYVVTIGLVLFSFSTIIAWAYYGEKCFEYLFGEKAVIYYRIVFCLVVIPGTAVNLEAAWKFSHMLNGLMAIPNLIALIALAPIIKEETATFLKLAEAEKRDSKRG
mgnify:CR=1 FL=1